MDIKNKIDKLRKELHEHNHLYYIENEPVISDVEFDKRLKTLESLEAQYPEFADPNSPTQRVGGDLSKKFATVLHSSPMLSLSNTYSPEELKAFSERVEKGLGMVPEYLCELKYDGVALALRYEKGNLTQALTRGNGFEGEEITNNARTINSIPLKLKEDVDLEVRGEVVLPFKPFNDLNRERLKEGLEPYANPRNTASGSLKLQDPKEVSKRGLEFICYSINSEMDGLKDQATVYKRLKALGFKIPNQEERWFEPCANIEAVYSFLDYWDQKRQQLPFATDGVVVKVNQFAHQQELGFTSKSPKWAIAYKFQAEKQSTQLEDISFQVGRTGAITPVAHLKPVEISGTVVKRASLHNADQIELLDIQLGDFVFVEKGGEIIPKITGVDESHPRGEKRIKFPNNCPACASPLFREADGVLHYCTNSESCPPQVKGRLIHFISKKAMEFENWGEETISELVDKGMAKKPSDLYRLNRDQLMALERTAEKSVENLILGAEQSKSKPLSALIFGLGIRYIGEKASKTLAKKFGSLDSIRDASLEDLLSVEEIGKKMAESVISYFSRPANRDLILELENLGLNVEEDVQASEDEFHELVAHKKWVISGVFTIISRKEMEALVEKLGGIKSSSISSKTHGVIAGDSMGPAKLEKAQKLGIKIYSEKEFLELIDRA